jgi:hypothetical protein
MKVDIRVHVELSYKGLPVIMLEEAGEDDSADMSTYSSRREVTYFANSVGLGHINVVPPFDQCINPVFLISSSSNIEYSFPTNAAWVFSGGLTSGWPVERVRLGGLGIARSSVSIVGLVD